MTAPWNQPGSGQPAGQQHPGLGEQVGRGRGGLVAGVAIGLVAAVLVGAVLVLTKVLGFDSGGATAPDTRPITLPETVGDVRDQLEVSKEKSKQPVDRLQARYQHTYALTSQRYQQAFGGAAVAVRSYADSDLVFLPTVIAVRAPSPGLFSGPVPDPEDLELAAGPVIQQVRQDGQVECYVAATRSVPKGQQVDPDDLRTGVCRRASSTLTVYVHGNAEGEAGHSKMVALTNAAFDAVNSGTA